MKKYENIVITYFINPHMFWFKFLTISERFHTFDLTIQKYFSDKIAKNELKNIQEFEIGDILGCYSTLFCKWFRGIIISQNNMNIHVWAIDLGFPTHITSTKNLFKIPKELRDHPFDFIMYSGLHNIIPASLTNNFDASLLEFEMEKTTEWSSDAIKISLDLIEKFNKIDFHQEIEVNTQIFGKLFLNNEESIPIDLCDVIKKRLQCAYSANFLKDLYRENENRIIELENLMPNNPDIKIDTEYFFLKRYNQDIINRAPSRHSDASNKKLHIRNKLKLNKKSPVISYDVSEISSISSISSETVEIQRKPILNTNTVEHLKKMHDNKSNQLRRSLLQENIMRYNAEKSFVQAQIIKSKISDEADDEQSYVNSTSSIADSAVRPSAEYTTASKNLSKEHLAESNQLQETQTLQQTAKEIFGSQITTSNDVFNEQADDSSSYFNSNSVSADSCANASVESSNTFTISKNASDNSKTQENKFYKEDSTTQHELSECIPTTSKRNFSTSEKRKMSFDEIIQKSESLIFNEGCTQKLRKTKSPNTDNNSIEPSSSNKNVLLEYRKHAQTFKTCSTVKIQNNLHTKDEVMTSIERARKQLVLVHGGVKGLTRKPIESLEQANFSEHIYKSMDRMKISQIYRIQCYSWSHLIRGNSIVIIGAEKTGKTFAYIPALMSLIMTKKEDNMVPVGIGPIAIILAANTKQVNKIARICHNFNPTSSKLSIVEGYGAHNLRNLQAHLYNGIDILIVTPGCLSRILDISKDFISKNRLKHFVIDDFHLVANQNSYFFKDVFKQCCHKNEVTQMYNVQFIITSCIWNNIFLEMLKLTANPLLCIGSYIESACYAKQNFKIILTSGLEKFNQIGEILSEKNFLFEHTLIICSENKEVDDVIEYLKLHTIACIGLKDNSEHANVTFANDWNKRTGFSLEVLVCTDFILPELLLDNVKHLIHYSLSITWTKFTLRFSSFFNSIKNALYDEKSKTSSIVFVDETNNTQLPRLIEFLEQHGSCNIPERIQKLSTEIRLQQEMAKINKNIRFCKYFLDFGVCHKRNTCKNRHVLSESEKSVMPTNLKQYIKLKIYNVFSPTHYAGEILSTRNNLNESWIDFDKSLYHSFKIKFKLHFGIKKNHIVHYPIEINDLCVVNKHNVYYRCKVLDIITKKSVLSDDIVIARAIDYGFSFQISSSRLLKIPDEFKLVEPRVVDIKLGGIKPIDGEHNWDDETKKLVETWVTKLTKKDNCFVQSSISFILSETFFVNTMMIIEDLKKYGGEINVKSIKRSLIKSNHCLADENQFLSLKDMVGTQFNEDNEGLNNLCCSAETFSNEENEITDSENDVKLHSDDQLLENNLKFEENSPETIFDNYLDNDSKNYETDLVLYQNNETPQCNEKYQELSEKCEWVQLSYFDSPSKFFVAKFSEIFRMLENLDVSQHESLDWITIGNYCLVYYENTYNRAKIVEIMSSSEVKVFFVDLGFTFTYKKIDLRTIPEYLLSKKFEAIECSLYGIKPINEWSEEISDEIYKEFDIFQDFYGRLIHKSNNKSEIILFGQSSYKDLINLNELIVINGHAKYLDETIKNKFAELKNVAKTEVEGIQNKKSIPHFDEKDFDSECSYDFSENGLTEWFEEQGCPIRQIIKNQKMEDEKKKETAKIIEVTDEEILKFNREDKNKRNETTNMLENTNQFEKEESYDNKNDMPALISSLNYVAPETVWEQDDTSIKLKVNATDHKYYCYNISKNFIYLLIEFQNHSSKELVLNLFGIIDVKYTRFEIRGNYFIFRLVKGIKKHKLLWPSLLSNNSKKFHWLKYNLDSKSIIDCDANCSSENEKFNIICDDEYRSSDSSDSNEEQMNADECDPFSTQFNFHEIPSYSEF